MKSTNIIKGLPISDWIYEQNPCCTLVVGLGYSPEPLLPCCIPHLQLDPFVLELDDFCTEVNSDGWDVCGGEVVAGVAKCRYDVRLTNSTIPNDYQLQHVVILLLHFVQCKWTNQMCLATLPPPFKLNICDVWLRTLRHYFYSLNTYFIPTLFY